MQDFQNNEEEKKSDKFFYIKLRKNLKIIGNNEIN